MTTKRYTDEQLVDAVASSVTVMEVMRKLGIRMAGGSHSHLSRRIQKMGIDTSHFTGRASNTGKPSPAKKTPEQTLIILPEGSRRPAAYQLTRALLELGVPYKCNTCGISEWCDRVITLQVDHIDGNWLDNRIDNLRFMCPNCHSQTSTYGAKNIDARLA